VRHWHWSALYGSSGEPFPRTFMPPPWPTSSTTFSWALILFPTMLTTGSPPRRNRGTKRTKPAWPACSDCWFRRSVRCTSRTPVTISRTPAQPSTRPASTKQPHSSSMLTARSSARVANVRPLSTSAPGGRPYPSSRCSGTPNARPVSGATTTSGFRANSPASGSAALTNASIRANRGLSLVYTSNNAWGRLVPL